MKKIIFILSLFIAVTVTAAPVVNPSIPSLTVGGRVFTDLSNLVILMGHTLGTGNASSLRKPGSSTGYTPPVGKSFRLLALKIITNSSSQSGIRLLSSTNDIGNNTATSVTGASYIYGDSNNYFTSGTTPGGFLEAAIDFTVPFGSYLTILSGGSTSDCFVIAYGYEK
jgi:hypothetical protein